MNKKIIFFDIDGTLVISKDGQEMILPSTIDAINKTKEKGNLVYLCTGRSKAEIYDFILDVGFDGIIGAGGGFVEVNNKTLYHKKISKNTVEHMVSFFKEHDYDYYLETNAGIFGNKRLKRRLEYIIYGDIDNDVEAREKMERKENHFINAITFTDDLLMEDINKACFLENPNIDFSVIEKEFANEFTVHHCTVAVFGDDSGELSIPGVDKATAIHTLLEHLQIPKENTYAFGDGLNDIEMLEYCEHGIAMGDAKAGLKVVADEICEDSFSDGIYNAMKRHNLI